VKGLRAGGGDWARGEEGGGAAPTSSCCCEPPCYQAPEKAAFIWPAWKPGAVKGAFMQLEEKDWSLIAL